MDYYNHDAPVPPPVITTTRSFTLKMLAGLKGSLIEALSRPLLDAREDESGDAMSKNDGDATIQSVGGV